MQATCSACSEHGGALENPYRLSQLQCNSQCKYLSSLGNINFFNIWLSIINKNLKLDNGFGPMCETQSRPHQQAFPAQMYHHC